MFVNKVVRFSIIKQIELSTDFVALVPNKFNVMDP